MLYPKIGIRPAIDGRWGGVREGWSSRLWQWRKAPRHLLPKYALAPTEHPCSALGRTTIGGGAEAARVADQFATEMLSNTDRNPMLVLRHRNI